MFKNTKTYGTPDNITTSYTKIEPIYVVDVEIYLFLLNL